MSERTPLLNISATVRSLERRVALLEGIVVRLNRIENRIDNIAVRAGYAQNNAAAVISYMFLDGPQPDISGFSRSVVDRDLAAGRLRLTRNGYYVLVNQASSDSEYTDNERGSRISSEVSR